MKTILVDDEVWMLEQFEDECRDIAEIEIVAKFRNPLKALEYAEANPIELAFLDIEMPQMNGFELCKRLLQLFPRLIVVFVSAYDRYVAEAAEECHTDYFLVKPYTKRDVEAVIDRAMLLSGRLRKHLTVRTFGAFEVYLKGQPLPFTDAKSREALAVLVDNRGETVSMRQLREQLGYTDDGNALLRVMAALQRTLQEAKISGVLQSDSRGYRVALEKADCDLMLFADGNPKIIRQFQGDYMTGYDWAEETRRSLCSERALLNHYQEDATRNTLCAIIRCRLDEPLTLLHVNDAFLALTGYDRAEIETLFANSFRQMIVPGDLTESAETIQSRLRQNPSVEYEYRLRCSDGRSLWVTDHSQLFERAVTGETVYDVECLLLDISATKAASAGSYQPAERDALTALYTRDTARKLVEEQLAAHAEGQQAALILLDINHFQKANERYGRVFADTVLTDVAAIMKRVFGPTDILCRLGGDEMLAFLPAIVDMGALRQKLNSFQETLRKRLCAKTAEGELSCSIGISFYPADGADADALYLAADKALSHARQTGATHAVLFDDMNEAKHTLAVLPHQRVEDESFLSYLQRQLDLSQDIPKTINALLAIVGRRLDASRVYLFENTGDQRYIVNTFEWCAEEIAPQIMNLQQLPGEQLDIYYTMMAQNGGLFSFYDVDALEPELYAILAPQGICSMLHAELLDEHGACYGFFGVDECAHRRYWSKEQGQMLQNCGREMGRRIHQYRLQHGMTLEDLHRFVLENQKR